MSSLTFTYGLNSGEKSKRTTSWKQLLRHKCLVQQKVQRRVETNGHNHSQPENHQI